jgi:hypothetical protein
MNPLIDPNTLRQQARQWSAQVGELSGQLPTRLQPNPIQEAGHPSTRLSSILAHLLQRSGARENAADKLKANEFMAP